MPQNLTENRLRKILRFTIWWMEIWEISRHFIGVHRIEGVLANIVMFVEYYNTPEYYIAIVLLLVISQLS